MCEQAESLEALTARLAQQISSVSEDLRWEQARAVAEVVMRCRGVDERARVAALELAERICKPLP